MRRLAQIVFFAAALGALALAAHEHGTLPARVATHFNQQGTADGWMPRDSHTLTQVAVTVFVAGLFSVLTLVLRRLPDRFINLPHREHWLAPERRADTLAWLGSMLLWLGAMLQAFLAYVFYEVWRANLAPKPELRLNLLWLQVSLFILTTGLVITLLYRFRKPEPVKKGKPGTGRRQR